MAQITTKSGPFKVENNAQTTPKQLRKCPENDFFDPQIDQNMDVNLVKCVVSWVQFRYTSPIFGMLAQKRNLNLFPLIAKGIQKVKYL